MHQSAVKRRKFAALAFCQPHRRDTRLRIEFVQRNGLRGETLVAVPRSVGGVGQVVHVPDHRCCTAVWGARTASDRAREIMARRQARWRCGQERGRLGQREAWGEGCEAMQARARDKALTRRRRLAKTQKPATRRWQWQPVLRQRMHLRLACVALACTLQANSHPHRYAATQIRARSRQQILRVIRVCGRIRASPDVNLLVHHHTSNYLYITIRQSTCTSTHVKLLVHQHTSGPPYIPHPSRVSHLRRRVHACQCASSSV